MFRIEEKRKSQNKIKEHSFYQIIESLRSINNIHLLYTLHVPLSIQDRDS